jgi:Zn finger protein HypA/HybF involved in hydrogenase expression
MDHDAALFTVLQMSDEEFRARHYWCRCCRNPVGRREVELYGACPRCGHPRVELEGFPVPAEHLH